MKIAVGFRKLRRHRKHQVRFRDDLVNTGERQGRTATQRMGLVHHTDAGREWAYDRQSSIGRLDKALDEASAKGWTVVDMKKDWKVIFPLQK